MIEENSRYSACINLYDASDAKYEAWAQIRLREMAARDVISQLELDKWYTVKLHVAEDVEPEYGVYKRLTMRVDIGRVEHREIVMPIMPKYDAMSWSKLTATALDEIKRRIYWKLFNLKYSIKRRFGIA